MRRALGQGSFARVLLRGTMLRPLGQGSPRPCPASRHYAPGPRARPFLSPLRCPSRHWALASRPAVRPDPPRGIL
eukprot:10676772-Alexandrium_andersonii.AAC.1